MEACNEFKDSVVMAADCKFGENVVIWRRLGIVILVCRTFASSSESFNSGGE